MVPSLWVELKSLPVTANGKIDRKALPDPDASFMLGNEYVAPRNEMEEKLAAIWKKLLNVEKVGVHDNFFELGGHSLMAIRIISTIKKELQVEIAINNLFIYPTINGLAEKIKNQNKGTGKTAIDVKYLVSLKPKGNRTPLYIVCGGGGTATRFKHFAEMLGPQQPVYALQPPIDTELSIDFPNKIEKIASIYINEILFQNPDGPYVLSGHCMGGIIAFEMAKQMEAMGKKIELLAMFDAFVPEKIKRKQFNLKNLFRKSTLIEKYPRIALQLYLLKHHRKVNLEYKMRNLKKLFGRLKEKFFGKKQESIGLEIFQISENIIKDAYRDYNMQPYDKEIIAFFVKEHYYYTHKEKNIIFGKTTFNDEKDNLWKRYSKSVTSYMIDGEHNSIFDPKHCDGFVKLLQQHLNNLNGRTTFSFKEAGTG
jgi:thioesterase domain-containing protein/acyl carrier protein